MREEGFHGGINPILACGSRNRRNLLAASAISTTMSASSNALPKVSDNERSQAEETDQGDR